MSQLDISKLDLKELKALAFDQQRELNLFQRNLEILFKEIEKKEKAEREKEPPK